MILIPKYNNIVELGGSLSIIVTDTTTNTIKQELYVPNAVVFTGKIFIASRVVGTSSTVMSHMGIGTDSTSVDAGTTTSLLGNQALGAELTVTPGGYTNYSRAALGTATNNSSNVVTYSANFAANNPSAPAAPTGAVLREAGIFNALTGGTMLCRTTFPIVTKLPADALTITWTVTIQ
jgi:hypothetical protein